MERKAVDEIMTDFRNNKEAMIKREDRIKLEFGLFHGKGKKSKKKRGKKK